MTNTFRPAQIRRIVNFVTANPGASRADIAQSLKFNTNEVGKALATLKGDATLVSTGAKKGTRWNVATLRDKLVTAISQNPGANRSFLISTLGTEKNDRHVTYLLTSMAEAGVVSKQGSKKGTCYFPAI